LAHLLVDKLVSAQLLARDGLGWRNLRVTESGRTMVGTA
jgi:hypothetical protein